MIQVVIKDLNLPSFNKFYSQGTHWSRRSDLVGKYKLIFASNIRSQISAPNLYNMSKFFPLAITIDIIFRKTAKIFDVDNCVMYGKLFLDTLKDILGVDDDYKHFNQLTYRIQKGNEQKVIYTINGV